MVQVHPLDTCGKLLRRFYEPLVLLSVLDPSRGAQRPDLIIEQGLDEYSKLWRNFLDQMSWLCDSETGGDTVTAVAAQKTFENSVFWVASNSNSREKARNHLIWLCAQLNRQHCSVPVSDSELEDQIATQCITFSSKRVKAYTIWLLQCINKAKDVMKESVNLEDEVLHILFQDIESLSHDPHQLCAFAYQCRRNEAMKILCKRHNVHSTRGVWSDIRHYLGRLGSWTKATKVLMRGAQKFPYIIENAQIQVIEPNGPADLPDKSHISNVKSALRRMCPAKKEDLVTELHQILEAANSFANVEKHFHEAYTTIRPRAHAELLILEHFYKNGFEFTADDRYIGCSKPSCYCCHLYFQCHAGRFTPRPCHGNLWPNWAPPIPLPTSTRIGESGNRPQEHETFKMLQTMLIHIRRDLQDQIVSKRPRRGKLPDSTTGMSSVTFGENFAISEANFDTIHAEIEAKSIDADFPDDDTLWSLSERESTACKVGKYQSKVKQTSTEFASTTECLPLVGQMDSNSESKDIDDQEVILFKGRNSLIR